MTCMEGSSPQPKIPGRLAWDRKLSREYGRVSGPTPSGVSNFDKPRFCFAKPAFSMISHEYLASLANELDADKSFHLSQNAVCKWGIKDSIQSRQAIVASNHLFR